MAVRHRVALVGHRHRSQPAGARVLERVTHDPVHALVGVDLFLNRDLVWRAGFESSADADVDALCVLAKDDEVHVGARAALQRTEAIVEQVGPAGS